MSQFVTVSNFTVVSLKCHQRFYRDIYFTQNISENILRLNFTFCSCW